MTINSRVEKIKEEAMKAALEDLRCHRGFGVGLNPFSTISTREDWQRGFDNKGHRSYESPETVHFCVAYVRGRCASILLEMEK